MRCDFTNQKGGLTCRKGANNGSVRGLRVSLIRWFTPVLMCVGGCVVNPVPTPATSAGGGVLHGDISGDAGQVGMDAGGVFDANRGGAGDATTGVDISTLPDGLVSDSSGADASLPQDATQTSDAVNMGGDATATDASDAVSDDAVTGDAAAPEGG